MREGSPGLRLKSRTDGGNWRTKLADRNGVGLGVAGKAVDVPGSSTRHDATGWADE